MIDRRVLGKSDGAVGFGGLRGRFSKEENGGGGWRNMTAAATSSWAFRLLFVNRRFYTWRIKRRNQERVIISPCLSLSCGVAQPPLQNSCVLL